MPQDDGSLRTLAKGMNTTHGIISTLCVPMEIRLKALRNGGWPCPPSGKVPAPTRPVKTISLRLVQNCLLPNGWTSAGTLHRPLLAAAQRAAHWRYSFAHRRQRHGYRQQHPSPAGPSDHRAARRLDRGAAPRGLRRRRASPPRPPGAGTCSAGSQVCAPVGPSASTGPPKSGQTHSAARGSPWLPAPGMHDSTPEIPH